MKIHFKTRSNSNIKSIDVMAFDFTQGTKARVLGMDEKGEGDVTSSFRDYSRSDNERIVKASFKPLKDSVSESAQEELIIYPELLGSGGRAPH